MSVRVCLYQISLKAASIRGTASLAVAVTVAAPIDLKKSVSYGGYLKSEGSYF